MGYESTLEIFVQSRRRADVFSRLPRFLDRSAAAAPAARSEATALCLVQPIPALARERAQPLGDRVISWRRHPSAIARRRTGPGLSLSAITISVSRDWVCGQRRRHPPVPTSRSAAAGCDAGVCQHLLISGSRGRLASRTSTSASASTTSTRKRSFSPRSRCGGAADCRRRCTARRWWSATARRAPRRSSTAPTS